MQDKFTDFEVVEKRCWVCCGCTHGMEGGGIDDFDNDLLLRLDSGPDRLGSWVGEKAEVVGDFGCFWSHLSVI